MRYFYDTEFLEDGRTIELISIGILAEDGREYYAVNKDAPWERIKENPWLMENVVPGLDIDGVYEGMTDRIEIADEVRQFINPRPGAEIELWADYGAYDHVVLAQLWGSMLNLPAGLPMFTHDIQQEASRIGAKLLPEQAEGEHNALADARHCFARWMFLQDQQ